MKTNVKLYRIESYFNRSHTPRLIEGIAKSITDAYITFDGTKDEFSRWETKCHARDLGRVYFDSPAVAWAAFREAEKKAIAEAKVRIEQAQQNIDDANDAINALYNVFRGAEVK